MEKMVSRLYQRIVLKLMRSVDRRAFTDLAVRSHNHNIGFHRNDYTFELDQVALVHVPKTGGTSLKALLAPVERSLINTRSHMPISLFCPPEKFRYVTFVRDPVERVYSYFRMQVRDESQPYHFHARDGLSTLLQDCWEIRNTYCMYYSGMIYENVTEAHFDIALSNLGSFFFVGDFSRFDNEANRLRTLLGCKELSEVPRLNSSGQTGPDSKERRLIEAYNLWDIKLYAALQVR